MIELAATDATSGVARIEYKIDNAPDYTPYDGPFTTSAGEHTVCRRAIDVAGNVSAALCTTIAIDLTDPIVSVSAPSTPGTGWFTTPISVAVSGTDPTLGSGFTPIVVGTTLVCDGRVPRPSADAPAGVCVSVDGGPFGPPTGAITLGEGVHRVRAFAVDGSGRRSAVLDRTYRIDRSAPVIAARLDPRLPARQGWYRSPPLMVLRATDGAQGSGVLALDYRIDGGAWTTYAGPFVVPHGVHDVVARATDAVGTRTLTTQVKVDKGFPTARATAPDPLVWKRSTQSTARLGYRIGDDLSRTVRVGVVIHDATGNVVRRIDGGSVTVTPGQQLNGYVTWDGKDATLTSLVPLGIYYYRVVVTDEAGNTSHSGESTRLTIRLL